MPNIIVTGSIGYDYIMGFSGKFADRIMPENIHKISLSFLVDSLNRNFGGTAVNIAYSLNLLGCAPLILAPAGKDFDLYEAFLKKQKISTKYIAIHNDVMTGSYFGITDQDNNQIGAFYSGALKYAKNLTIPSDASFVIVSPTAPDAMKKYVAECRKLQIPYLYDPAFQIGSFSPDELREGIEGATFFIGNDYEIDLVQQKLEISHEELLVMGPTIITTLGAKGSIIETRKEAIHVKPAMVENTSDPTGAGDAYRAGFLAGYLRLTGSNPVRILTGDEFATCGQMGSIAAAYTVELYGTQTHTYTKKEFTKRYELNYGKFPLSL